MRPDPSELKLTAPTLLLEQSSHNSLQRMTSGRADHGTGAGDNGNVTLLRPEFFAAHMIRALSGLSLEGEEHDILQDIHKGNCEGKQEDTVTKSTTELWRSKGKSVIRTLPL
jgi:hypothetical protein